MSEPPNGRRRRFTLGRLFFAFTLVAFIASGFYSNVSSVLFLVVGLIFGASAFRSEAKDRRLAIIAGVALVALGGLVGYLMRLSSAAVGG
ncbi:MAG: hypothetical protein AAGB00_12280 [Planctomycetota bacterium]